MPAIAVSPLPLERRGGGRPGSRRYGDSPPVARRTTGWPKWLTDGVVQLDPFELGSWEMLIEFLNGRGPAALIDRVRQAEDSDPRPTSTSPSLRSLVGARLAGWPTLVCHRGGLRAPRSGGDGRGRDAGRCAARCRSGRSPRRRCPRPDAPAHGGPVADDGRDWRHEAGHGQGRHAAAPATPTPCCAPAPRSTPVVCRARSQSIAACQRRVTAPDSQFRSAVRVMHGAKQDHGAAVMLRPGCGGIT